jgi:hypothetical protein
LINGIRPRLYQRVEERGLPYVEYTTNNPDVAAFPLASLCLSLLLYLHQSFFDLLDVVANRPSISSIWVSPRPHADSATLTLK